MRLIGVEEHWCPRELFEQEGTPGYESMRSVKAIFSKEQYEKASRSVSDIGEGRLRMMDAVGLDMQVLSLCSANMEVLPPDSARHYSKLSNDILADGIKSTRIVCVDLLHCRPVCRTRRRKSWNAAKVWGDLSVQS